MKLYLSNVSCREKHFGTMVPYRLESFAGSWNDLTLKNLKEHCKPENVLIDSGAFTFRTKQPNIDFKELTKRYADFINVNGFEQFFEMDVDDVIGYDNVLVLRDMLESETGKKCIPVFHVGRGKDEFVKMCERYSYVAIGGLAGIASPERMDVMLRWGVRTAHEHGAKIHGLGMMSGDVVQRYPFDSVDSSSWVFGGRQCEIVRFDGTNIRWKKLTRPSGTRLNYIKLDRFNLQEYLKFIHYAENIH